MLVRDVMTQDPICCTPETPLERVAKLMVEYDCGAVPVIRDEDDYRPIGMITDRDIVVRALAEGRNPLNLVANDCMSNSCVTVEPDAGLAECGRIMEAYQVRRVLVVDAHGEVVGLVAQADLAGAGSEEEVAQVLKGISQPSYALDEFAEFPAQQEGR
jgi:CBS domain-containing protein